MIFIILLPFYTLIALLQIPGLVREKNWHDLVIFSCFLAFAFLFSLLLGLDVKIPSPLKLIQEKIQDPLNLHY